MKIAGLNKTTLLDYPELVAATVFTAGCNFRCPFCHNRDLVMGEGLAYIPEEEVLAFLEKRRKVLAGVCISGGEPTLQPDLGEFIRKVKRLGYRVKLDTNGYRPEVLRELLAEDLLDYVAMDLKNCKAKYAVTAGRPELELTKIITSVEMIKRSGIPHEFRTTVVKELHTESDLMEIGKWIGESGAACKQGNVDLMRSEQELVESGAVHKQDNAVLMEAGQQNKIVSRYSLQNFEENENVIRAGFHSYEPEEMHEFARKLTEQGIFAIIKGVI